MSLKTITASGFASGLTGVQHGFFGRQGGVSSGLYSSLNCGPGSQDQAEHVQENRRRVAAHFGQTVAQLCTVWQVHSPDCVTLDFPFTVDRPKADAMVTDRAGLVLGVLTADCGPVLFAGQKPDGAPVIGAAHAGWGGALKGVLESTLAQMIAKGCDPQTIEAAVGPCIGPRSYEVSDGFDAPFVARDPADERFFRPAQKAGHKLFDLPGYISARLARAGVTRVILTDRDTFAEEAEFFSYRRTTHRGEADYGRQISAIMIAAV